MIADANAAFVIVRAILERDDFRALLARRDLDDAAQCAPRLDPRHAALVRHVTQYVQVRVRHQDVTESGTIS